MKQNNTGDKADLLTEIDNASLRLKRIIDNFLDISKLHSGHISLKKDWVDLRDILHPIVNEFIQESDRHRIQLIIKEPIDMIFADPILLSRLLENLILNAVQYSSADCVVELEDKDKEIEIRIHDSGPGIPEHYHAAIFQKFFRIPGSKAGGTGLGLAIVYEIALLHGGKVTVTSGKPTGTLFTVTLPKETTDEARC